MSAEVADATAAPPAPPVSAPGTGWGADSAVVRLTGAAAGLVILGIFLSLLMGALDQFVVLTALPNIVREFGQPNGATFVVSAYLITSTVAVPIFARLSDISSRRNIFLVGMGIFIAGSALAGLSQNLGELIAFRGVQGFGSGCFFPVGLSIIAVAFPPETRARLTGAFSGVFGIATVAGPFLGSTIVDNTTWRWVFYINIPIGVIGAVILAYALGALRPSKRETFDVGGAALLSAWVGALMFALFQVSDSGWAWSDPRIIGLLAGFVAGFIAFVVYELRLEKPLVPLRLFKDRVVASSSAVSALSRGAIFALITIMSVYVGFVLYHNGPGASDAVRDMLYFMVIPMVVGAFIGGQSLTRVNYRPLVASGMAIAAVGMYLLTMVTPSTPTWQFTDGFLPTGGLILPLMPLGFGLGLTFGPTTLAVQYRVAPKDVGQATGLIQFLGTLGAAVGLSLFGAFQTWRFANVAPSAPPAVCYTQNPPSAACQGLLASYPHQLLQAFVTSYVSVFEVMLVLVVLAFLASLFLTGGIPKKPRAAGASGAEAGPASAALAP